MTPKASHKAPQQRSFAPLGKEHSLFGLTPGASRTLHTTNIHAAQNGRESLITRTFELLASIVPNCQDTHTKTADPIIRAGGHSFPVKSHPKPRLLNQKSDIVCKDQLCHRTIQSQTATSV